MITPSPYNDPSQSRPRPLNKRHWQERGSTRYTLASLISCTWYFHIPAFQYFRMSGLLDLWCSVVLEFRRPGLCIVPNVSRSRFPGISKRGPDRTSLHTIVTLLSGGLTEHMRGLLKMVRVKIWHRSTCEASWRWCVSKFGIPLPA